jgi:hypothetical protein
VVGGLVAVLGGGATFGGLGFDRFAADGGGSAGLAGAGLGGRRKTPMLTPTENVIRPNAIAPSAIAKRAHCGSERAAAVGGGA